jgi:HEAT repeat protein
MASEGAIPILIEYMKNNEGDVVAKQYCAMALGNLAAEPENHMEIVKSEGIDALITVLRSEDIEGGRYSAFGLSNLAANANHRERIVEEGAVACLVSLACCEDVNAQRQGKSHP